MPCNVAKNKENKLHGYIIQQGEYSQYLMITINGVLSKIILNHYVVYLKLILYFNYNSIKNKITLEQKHYLKTNFKPWSLANSSKKGTHVLCMTLKCTLPFSIYN